LICRCQLGNLDTEPRVVREAEAKKGHGHEQTELRQLLGAWEEPTKRKKMGVQCRLKGNFHGIELFSSIFLST
jgi:hypothetical protein